MLSELSIRTRDVSHLNPTKLRQLHEAHFPKEDYENDVEAMYHLADVYDVQTLWKKTCWDLESEISSV